MVEFHGWSNRNTRLAQGPLRNLTRRGALFADQQRLTRQLRPRDRRPDRMLRADDQLQLVDDARGDTALAWPQDVAADDRDVDFTIAHTLLHNPGIRNSQRDRD